MKGVLRQVLTTTLVSHLVAIIIMLVAALAFQSGQVRSEFGAAYTLDTIVVAWVDYFVPICLTGLTLSFAVILNAQELRTAAGGSTAFMPLVRSTVVLVLILAVVNVLLVMFLQGSARTDQEYQFQNSHQVTTGLEAAAAAYSKGDKEPGLLAVKRVLAVLPGDPDAIRLRDRLAAMPGQAGTSPGSGSAPGSKVSPVATAGSLPPSSTGTGSVQSGLISASRPLSQTYAGLVDQIQAALTAQEPFQAFYFIARAREARVANGAGPEAQLDRWEAEARDLLVGRAAGRDKANPLDDLKRQVWDQLSGDGDGYAAWKLLVQIELTARRQGGEANPTFQPDGPFVDPDVARFVPLVHERLSHMGYLSSEIGAQLAWKGQVASRPSLFVRTLADGNLREYLFATDIARAEFSWYLKQPELLRVRTTGQVLFHLKSDWAKLVPSGLGPSDRQASPIGPDTSYQLLVRQFGPSGNPDQSYSVLTNASATDPSSVQGPDPAVQPITLRPEDLWSVAGNDLRFELMPVAEQLAILPAASMYGFDDSSLRAVLLDELLRALAFPSLCFLAIAWGWSQRSRYLARPPFLTFLVILLLVPVMLLLSQAVQSMVSVGGAALSLWLGWSAALPVAIVMMAGLLLTSLVVLATRRFR